MILKDLLGEGKEATLQELEAKYGVTAAKRMKETEISEARGVWGDISDDMLRIRVAQARKRHRKYLQREARKEAHISRHGRNSAAGYYNNV